MTRLQRRVVLYTGSIGVLLTAIVLVFDTAGLLAASEDWLYDVRARRCQNFTPPPTDKLVHIEIDDRALEVIGDWPWPRWQLAEIIDEIRLAGAKALAMDVLFVEPQDLSYEVESNAEGKREIKRERDNDALLAASIKRFGHVILPASVTFAPPSRSARHRAAVAEFDRDLELSELELGAVLRERGFGGEDLDRALAQEFLSLRREAAFARIEREMAVADLSLDALRLKLLRKSDWRQNSPLTRVIEREYGRFKSIRTFRELMAGAAPGSQSLLNGRIAAVPLSRLAEPAAAGAFVDYIAESDGKVRSVPLMVDCGGRMLPQLGFSLALEMMEAKLSDVQLHENRIVIRQNKRDLLSVPIRRDWSEARDQYIPMVFDIPWFGSPQWETMYDWPKYREPRQRIAIDKAWAPCFTRQKLIRNIGAARDAIGAILFLLNSPKFEQFAANPPPDDRPEPWFDLIETTLRDMEPQLKLYAARRPADLDDDARKVVEAAAALRQVRQQNDMLLEQLRSDRRALAAQLQDRAVLIGWAVTARTDWTPTSIHRTCPGVIAHGTIFNAMMTGDFWRMAPNWVTWLMIGLLGMGTTAASARFSALPALLITMALGAGYILINSILLFDYGNLVVGLAGPLVALCLAWAGCSLARIIIETSERARVTQRFRSYVDPTLVNYLIERPDQVRLEGETRELTVAFTDLAGFTKLAEEIGERSVAVLNRVMETLVPHIRGHRGYLDKFLGDGIMFFFGAPIHNANHASDAITAVLHMHEALVPLNQEFAKEGLPQIGMRAGVSTGKMVVGDAGSTHASDYTVLGDAVNLGSRLESANKTTGTQSLISERTKELAGERFLYRPVGKLQVVGKTRGVMVYEPIAFREQATAKQMRLVECSTLVVESFLAARFSECLHAAAQLEAEFGPSKLAYVYFEQCEIYLRTPPAEGFDGRIVVTDK